MSSKIPFILPARKSSIDNGAMNMTYRRESMLQKAQKSYNFNSLRTSPGGGIDGTLQYSVPVKYFYNPRSLKRNTINDSLNDYDNNTNSSSKHLLLSTSYRKQKQRRQKWLQNFKQTQQKGFERAQFSQFDQLLSAYSTTHNSREQSPRLSSMFQNKKSSSVTAAATPLFHSQAPTVNNSRYFDNSSNNNNNHTNNNNNTKQREFQNPFENKKQYENERSKLLMLNSSYEDEYDDLKQYQSSFNQLKDPFKVVPPAQRQLISSCNDNRSTQPTTAIKAFSLTNSPLRVPQLPVMKNTNNQKMPILNLKRLKKNTVFKHTEKRVSTHNSVDLPPFSGTFDIGCVTEYDRNWRGSGLNHRLYNRFSKVHQIEDRHLFINDRLLNIQDKSDGFGGSGSRESRRENFFQTSYGKRNKIRFLNNNSKHHQNDSLKSEKKPHSIASVPETDEVVQREVERLLNIQRKRGSMLVEMAPKPIISRKPDDGMIYSLASTKFNRSQQIRQSMIPVAAVFNSTVNRLKQRQLLKNQKNSSSFVIMTPNKALIKEQAEIVNRDTSKRISVPLHTKKRSKTQIRQKWQQSIRKVAIALKMKKSTNYVEEEKMTGFFEAKLQKMQSVKQLKNRYSQFDAVKKLNKKNIQKLGPLKFVKFTKEQEVKQPTGPLAGNEFQQMLNKQKRIDAIKNKFKPIRKTPVQIAKRRESRVHYSKWYLQNKTTCNSEHHQQYDQQTSRQVVLDIEAENIGNLSIKESQLEKLPNTVRSISRNNNRLNKTSRSKSNHSDGKSSRIQTIYSMDESGQELNFRNLKRLVKDPFKKLEKAMQNFNAKLGDQIQMQLYTESDQSVGY